MGRELHRAGVATDAIEQTLTDLAESIGLVVQIFALPTYITIASGPDWEQRIVMMRLEPGRISLRKIALLNEVYDQLRNGRISFLEATELLANVDASWPGLPPWWSILAFGLIAAGVAMILGGGVRELTVSALIGLFCGALVALSTKSALLSRLYPVASAFIATLVVGGFQRIVGPMNVYISIVAGIVVLLPGYTLTLALHELANDFLVAGMARLGRVLSVLLSLGCGAFLALAIVPSLLSSGTIQTHPVATTFWIIASICMAVGLSIELDARPRDFFWVFASCVVALLTAHLVGASSAHAVSAFVSAFVCGMVANLGARFLRVPQAIMLVPALIVLVPGSLSYESVLFAVAQNVGTALTLAANATFAAIQLVAGLLLSQLVLPASTLRLRPRD